VPIDGYTYVFENKKSLRTGHKPHGAYVIRLAIIVLQS
jgi:hypothetical protein